MVVSILAAAIIFQGNGPDTYVTGLERRIRQSGGKSIEEPGDLMRYFGQAADGGGLETSRMLQECWHAWRHLQQFSNGFQGVREINEGELGYIYTDL